MAAALLAGWALRQPLLTAVLIALLPVCLAVCLALYLASKETERKITAAVESRDRRDSAQGLEQIEHDRANAEEEGQQWR